MGECVLADVAVRRINEVKDSAGSYEHVNLWGMLFQWNTQVILRFKLAFFFRNLDENV